MSYGDFNAQISARGATAIHRVGDDKTTTFTFAGEVWICADNQRRIMTTELADGYEMAYCLAQYCHQEALHEDYRP